MRIYISGPITDDPDYLAHFQQAEDQLRRQFPEAEIVNPTKAVPFDPKKTWLDYMREDIKLLADCTHIRLLNGWQSSRGARAERSLAFDLEIKIV